MAELIPTDAAQPNVTTAHTTDHNNISDMIGLLTQSMAQMAGNGAAYHSGDTANISQIHSFLNSGLMVAAPVTGAAHVYQVVDGSYLVTPKTTGDDALSINAALSRLTAPGTAGSSVVRLVAGGTYNIQSTIGLANWTYGTYLDLNWSTLNLNLPAGADGINFMGHESGGYTQNYRAGGAYNGSLVDNGSGSGCTGLRYGAGEGFFFDNIRVHQMSDASNNSYGIVEDNTQGWTEKTHLRAECTENDNGFYVFTPSGSGFTSHEYNFWDLFIRGYESQVLMLVSGNGAYTSGSELHLKGNCGMHAHPSGATGAAAAIDLSQGGLLNNMLCNIQTETTGSGSYNWQTIKMGAAGQIVNSNGQIRMVGGNYTASDATAAANNFQFGGVVNEFNSGASIGLRAANSKPIGWL